MKSSKSRWEMAQDYEKSWWSNKVPEIDLEFYERFAGNVVSLLKPFFSITENTYVLEIGSGAAGIITYIESNHKFAIDPLENFYSSVQKYKSIRDSKVKYSTGKAEKLPYEEEYFDLIIIDNVLDHCENPDKVLLEMRRVLKSNGVIYFRQNTYHIWGKILRELIEMIKIDKGHPHTFMKKSLKKKFYKYDFQILEYRRTGYFNTWHREIRSKNFIDKIKGVLFINRDKTTYILKKT